MKRYLAIAAFILGLAGGGSAHAGDHAAMNHAAMAKTEKSSVLLTLVPQDTLMAGKPVTVLVKLNNVQQHSLITPDQLEVTHTQPLHLLLIDQTFTDYQHIHPEPTATPGIYSFTFTPALPGAYRVWADVTLKSTGTQEFAMADLGNYHPGAIDRSERNETVMEGYRFGLSFDKPPVAGGESVAMIHVTSSSGQPVDTLEPVMGAFAHLVGFYDDFHTVLHTHPMDGEAADSTARGGPDLMFHLMPQKSGFIRLFAQVKINGRELFVPFGISVEKAP
ncbi:MAG: hypothetical protein KGJ06_06670 [Pseudomonadota bacterium]|nr:hypothetical protein [Pseudomonadota bacterium]